METSTPSRVALSKQLTGPPKYHVIVDGHNLSYRVAAKLSLSFKGQDTSILFGALQSIRSFIGPSVRALTVCWDGGRSAFRRKLFPEYKSRRSERDTDFFPDNMHDQIREVMRLLSYLGVRQYRFDGVEGDDAIYWLAREADVPPTIVVSTDNDFLQMVTNRISVFNPSSQMLNTLSSMEGQGWTPDSFLLFKIVGGDHSDGIPGVPGVGEVTAKALATEFGSFFDLMHRLDQVRSDANGNTDRSIGPIKAGHKRGQSLKESMSLLRRNRKLIDLWWFWQYHHQHSFGMELSKVYSSHSEYAPNEFLQRVRKHGLKSITDDFSTWIVPFRKLLVYNSVDLGRAFKAPKRGRPRKDDE